MVMFKKERRDPYPQANHYLSCVGIVAALLTLGYLLFQYWGSLMKLHSGAEEEELRPPRHARSRSRSASRSSSRSGSYKAVDSKRRGRKSHRRRSHCSLCDYGKK